MLVDLLEGYSYYKSRYSICQICTRRIYYYIYRLVIYTIPYILPYILLYKIIRLLYNRRDLSIYLFCY